MSRIRSKNTQPEAIVRKALTKHGLRYKLHVDKLPGNPDLLITKNRTAIFINGCFWHQHKGCKRKTMPKTNISYWSKKLKRNVEKQKKDIRKLKKIGWKVGIIWECEAKKDSALEKKLTGILNGKKL